MEKDESELVKIMFQSYEVLDLLRIHKIFLRKS